MIFVTVGSQKFPFNRLLQKVDQLLAQGVITEEVFAQTGASDYLPRHFQYQAFCAREQFSALMERCSVMITHGGAGTMVEAVKRRKRTIVVPRLASYGEHVDDHQLQLLEQFQRLNLVHACLDLEQLPQALETVRTHSYDAYHSNTQAFIASLDDFIRSMAKPLEESLK